ncbi:MAG TPA: histidinol-phosphate transaminase [Syntrophales bacterium]|nr:histidinol-phosphate transaminase [Syntrophales bacterium]
MSYFRANIERMTGYKPGEQPPAGAKVIKLNTNENPYPPSPEAVRALREVLPESLRRYPDPFAGQACRAIGRVFGFPQEWIIAGNGSDEILSMVFRACAEPGRPVVYPFPTYVLYRTLAEIQDAPVVEVPFDDDYNLPLEKLIAARGAVTLVASPNSPSGNTFPAAFLDELASQTQGIIVIDEAYADFARENALDLVRKRENVLVLRTLSKGYSLAGLRFGFGIARPGIIEALMKVKDSYNIDAAVIAVAAAAIEDQAHKNGNAEKVIRSRAVLAEDLSRLGFRVWPSQSNFILVRPPAGDAERLYLGLKSEGILVRWFDQESLRDKLRISVGTDEQNNILVRNLSRLLKA